MSRLPHTLALITGGSSGIGLAVARLLAKEGCRLILCARGLPALEAAQKSLIQDTGCSPDSVSIRSLDVSDPGNIKQGIEEIAASAGVPDLVIHSAGIGMGDYFDRISPEAFDRVMRTNVYGTWHLVQALLPLMEGHGGGRIVLLSSAAGLMGMYGYSAYGCSKFAVMGLADCLRGELKPRGIAVTVVCPPEVDTPLIHEEEKTLPPEARAVKNLPGRLSPENAARAILRGIKKKRFLVIPGFLARGSYLFHRYSNGFLSRWISDMAIRRVQRKKFRTTPGKQ